MNFTGRREPHKVANILEEYHSSPKINKTNLNKSFDDCHGTGPRTDIKKNILIVNNESFVESNTDLDTSIQKFRDI